MTPKIDRFVWVCLTWYLHDREKQIDLEPDFIDALNELMFIEGKDSPSKQRFNIKGESP